MNKRTVGWTALGRIIAIVSAVAGTLGIPAPATGASRDLLAQQFMVDGASRDALVYVPPGAKSNDTPVVFVFHGHGGTARNAARSFAIEQHWPEAIVVYPQGLNTPGRLTDPEGRRPGWQASLGAQGNRDLRFFDTVLAALKKDWQVDGKRIYSTGHSNGGGFTYLLWETRAHVLAAVAPSSAAAGMREARNLKPKPAMHIAGENDRLVKFEWQKLMIEAVRKINGCAQEGKPWGEGCILYESKKGTPLVTLIHPGGHEFYRHAPSEIVKFFKQHPAPK